MKNQKDTLTLTQLENETNIFNFYTEENLKVGIKKQEVQNSTPQDLIDQGFNEIEAQVKNDLLEKLKTLDPFYFEKVILILLKKMGYGDFIETSKSGLNVMLVSQPVQEYW